MGDYTDYFKMAREYMENGNNIPAPWDSPNEATLCYLASISCSLIAIAERLINWDRNGFPPITKG